MKKRIVVIIMFFWVFQSKAQHDHSSHDHGDADHSHKADPPHGGEIKDVGKYHLEIVFDVAAPVGEKMSIYILKSNLKTLDSKEASGSISVKYKNGTEENYSLENNNIDKLYCDVKDVANSFNAIIKIKYKGKEYSCSYYYKGMK